MQYDDRRKKDTDESLDTVYTPGNKTVLKRVGDNSGVVYDHFGNEIRKVPVRSETPDKLFNTEKKDSEDEDETVDIFHKPEKEPHTKKPVREGRNLYHTGADKENRSTETKGVHKREANVGNAKTPLSSIDKYTQSRKDNRKKVVLFFVRIAVFLLCVGVVVVIVSLSGTGTNSVNTAQLKKGSIEKSFSADVNFIRNEEQVLATFSGTFLPTVNEGDRVYVGEVIGHVISENYTDKLIELKKIEEKIYAAQAVSSYIDASGNSSINAVESAIKTVMLDICKEAMTLSMEEYAEHSDELIELYKTKNELLLNAESNDVYINKLKAERDVVLSDISLFIHEIMAMQSGIISFYTDNGENNVSLKAGSISEYTKNIDSETYVKPTIEDLTYGDIQLINKASTMVDNGEVVARITPDIKYYMTVRYDDIDKFDIKEGMTLSVKSQSRDFGTQAKVISILREDSKSLLIMESSSNLIGSISGRKVMSDIVISRFEGLRVPLRCLAELDSAGATARITIVRSSYVQYIYVDILDSDDKYAIISSGTAYAQTEKLRINDIYVIEYEKVKEGQIYN